MSYNHLSIKERVSIEIYYQLGYSKRKIGKYLCRSHSTVVRKLKRLKEYCPDKDLKQYKQFRLNSKWNRKLTNRIKKEIIEELRKYFSSEQIANGTL